RGEGDILRRADLGVAQPHQVDGDAAPPVLDALDDVAPVITIDRDAMDEQCHRALASFEIGDAPGFDLGEAAAGVKSRDVHSWLRCCGGYVGPLSAGALSRSCVIRRYGRRWRRGAVHPGCSRRSCGIV